MTRISKFVRYMILMLCTLVFIFHVALFSLLADYAGMLVAAIAYLIFLIGMLALASRGIVPENKVGYIDPAGELSGISAVKEMRQMSLLSRITRLFRKPTEADVIDYVDWLESGGCEEGCKNHKSCIPIRTRKKMTSCARNHLGIRATQSNKTGYIDPAGEM